MSLKMEKFRNNFEIYSVIWKREKTDGDTHARKSS